MSVILYDSIGGEWYEDGTPTERSNIQEPINIGTRNKPTYTQLEKKLSWCYEERNHFVRVINEAIRICNMGDKRIAELEANVTTAIEMSKLAQRSLLIKHKEVEEWEASFKLYDDAMRRGTKIWQDATGEKRIWPDAAQLTAWLISRCDQLEKVTKEYAEALSRILVLEEDLNFHKKVRSAQVDMITRLIEKSGQLKTELAERNATLDKVDTLTKHIEMKVDNLQRNVDLAIEQKIKMQTELDQMSSYNETLIDFNNYALKLLPGIYTAWVAHLKRKEMRDNV